jgi:hypothetical protein
MNRQSAQAISLDEMRIANDAGEQCNLQKVARQRHVVALRVGQRLR